MTEPQELMELREKRERLVPKENQVITVRPVLKENRETRELKARLDPKENPATTEWMVNKEKPECKEPLVKKELKANRALRVLQDLKDPKVRHYTAD